MRAAHRRRGIPGPRERNPESRAATSEGLDAAAIRRWTALDPGFRWRGPGKTWAWVAFGVEDGPVRGWWAGRCTALFVILDRPERSAGRIGDPCRNGLAAWGGGGWVQVDRRRGWPRRSGMDPGYAGLRSARPPFRDDEGRGSPLYVILDRSEGRNGGGGAVARLAGCGAASFRGRVGGTRYPERRRPRDLMLRPSADGQIWIPGSAGAAPG